MVKTSKQKNTDTGTSQDRRKHNTETHTETNKRLRARDMKQGETSSGAELVEGFLPRSQTTNVGIPSFVLSGTKRAAAALAMAAAICTRKRENREPRSLVKVS